MKFAMEMVLQKELDKAHRETKRLIGGMPNLHVGEMGREEMGYLHEGEFMPVAADKIVTYRTMSIDGVLSHWHGYIAAGSLNWSSFARIQDTKSKPWSRRVTCPMVLGRIYDYKTLTHLRK